MSTVVRRIGLALALALGDAVPVQALDVVLDYRYDESGFFDAPERRAVLEHAARLYTRSVDAELGELPEGEWAAVFPDPGRADRVVYRDLGVERSTLHVFVAARPRGAADPVHGVPGYAAWRCDDPRDPAACAAAAAQHAPQAQRAWLERFVFRSRPAAAAWPPRAFAPWGGSLSFASDVDWHVGIDGPVPPAQLDLLSAAVRELGRIFGVGTAGSWGTRTVTGCFEGPRVRAESGVCLPLAPDLGQLSGSVMGRLAGTQQPAAFAPGLQPGERRRLTALDEAVLQDLGWERSRPEDEGSARVVMKGDVSGDGRVDRRDLNLLGSGTALDEDQQWAGDVAPMIDREAVGDGKLDGADLEVLRAAIEQWDVDGDGIPTALENALNAASAAISGSLLYHPLQRWPDACAAGFAGVAPYFGPTSRPVLFCGRAGGPWFDLPWIPRLPPDDLVLPQGIDFTPSGADPTRVVADRLAMAMWITLRWSPRPDVSPELYLEIVGASERAAVLAAPTSSSPSVDGVTPSEAPATSLAPHPPELQTRPLQLPVTPEPEASSTGPIVIPPPPTAEQVEPVGAKRRVAPAPEPGSRIPEPEIEWRVPPAEVAAAAPPVLVTPAPAGLELGPPERTTTSRRDLIRELLDALAELWARLKAALA